MEENHHYWWLSIIWVTGYTEIFNVGANQLGKSSSEYGIVKNLE